MRNGRNGWLVSNGGLQIPKFIEQVTWLVETFAKRNVVLHPLCNHDLTAAVVSGHPVVVRDGKRYGSGLPTSLADGKLPDFVLFWDKDVRLALMMERAGFRLFNSASTIALCDDKSATHRILSGQGIPMPDTLMAPKNFPGLVAEKDAFVDNVEQMLGYPVVIKESYGSFGDQVFLATDRAALGALHDQMRYVPHIAQRFISSSHGRDVRLQVVGDRVVASMLRRSASDFRANVSAGGVMEPYDPPMAFCDLAIRAAQAVGADFAGVDLLFGEDDQPLICEINSNAHMRNIEQCTGVDVPAAIADWILRQLDATATG